VLANKYIDIGIAIGFPLINYYILEHIIGLENIYDEFYRESKNKKKLHDKLVSIYFGSSIVLFTITLFFVAIA